MSCFKRCLGGTVVILCLLSMITGFSLIGIASWLNAKSEPKSSDFLLILAGMPTRAITAADLYLADYAPKILISRPTMPAGVRKVEAMGITITHLEDIYLQVLLQKGVPLSAITIMEKSAISTTEEALRLKHLFPDKSTSFLIVTSPFHIRRAEMIFKSHLPFHEITVVGTDYERFPSAWWTDQDAARNVLLELAKILFYKIGGQFVTQDRHLENKQ